jgi:hypothetical protein
MMVDILDIFTIHADSIDIKNYPLLLINAALHRIYKFLCKRTGCEVGFIIHILE